MTEPLYPAALAVMTAGTMGNPNVINDPVYRQCIAAALRAAADQVVPPAVMLEYYERSESPVLGKALEIRGRLLAIAAELEAVE